MSCIDSDGSCSSRLNFGISRHVGIPSTYQGRFVTGKKGTANHETCERVREQIKTSASPAPTGTFPVERKKRPKFQLG